VHPKTKISFRLITILLNLFIIFSLLFNFGGNTPVKAQTETDPPIGLAHPLEILQGSLLRRQVLSGEMASITLNISDPQPDVSYSWMILEAPSHGNSQVIATGAEATITYLAEPGFEGEDFLKVVATEQHGRICVDNHYDDCFSYGRRGRYKKPSTFRIERSIDPPTRIPSIPCCSR